MRLIDADKLIARVKKNAPFIYHVILPIVALTHTEDAEPVRYGEWVDIRMDTVCSVCGATFNDNLFWIHGDCVEPNYCPICGAKMDA